MGIYKTLPEMMQEISKDITHTAKLHFPKANDPQEVENNPFKKSLTADEVYRDYCKQRMEYKRKIVLTEDEKTYIKKCLESTDMMEENDTWSKTADFGNGIEMDIKLCGSRDEKPWTEAVLFLNGHELCHSDVFDEFEGEWELEYNENEYSVSIC